MPHFDPNRPLSYSSLNLFTDKKWGGPEKWYKKYILKEKDTVSAEMEFGKRFAKSVEDGEPLAPVTLLKHAEYPLSVVFAGIPLIGYVDGYTPHTHLIEYKTSGKVWTQLEVDKHRQFDMYLLMLYITYKIWPEDIDLALECIQTVKGGDFEMGFVKPMKVHRFKTKRTRMDILSYGQWIKETRLAMMKYCEKRAGDNLLASKPTASIISK